MTLTETQKQRPRRSTPMTKRVHSTPTGRPEGRGREVLAPSVKTTLTVGVHSQIFAAASFSASSGAAC